MRKSHPILNRALEGNFSDRIQRLQRALNQIRSATPEETDDVLTWGNTQENVGSAAALHYPASTFTAQILPLYVRHPIQITKIYWMIYAAGTYQLRRLWEANIASTYETLTTLSGPIGATSSAAYVPDVPLVLMPGMHYLGLYISPAVNWEDANTASFTSADGAFTMAGIYYNTTGYNYVPPVYLDYQLGTWS